MPFVNPLVIFREELDDRAVLFDPDGNEAFVLNLISTFIWKLIDGKHSEKDILIKLNEVCKDTFEDVPRHLSEFLEELANKSLTGFKKIAVSKSYESGK